MTIAFPRVILANGERGLQHYHQLLTTYFHFLKIPKYLEFCLCAVIKEGKGCFAFD